MKSYSSEKLQEFLVVYLMVGIPLDLVAMAVFTTAWRIVNGCWLFRGFYFGRMVESCDAGSALTFILGIQIGVSVFALLAAGWMTLRARTPT